MSIGRGLCGSQIQTCGGTVSNETGTSWGLGQVYSGVHKLFAENLRAACLNVGSIAAACEGAGINRQQFNKYLAGASFPNALTLRKICEYLGVTEQSLFSRPEIDGPQLRQNPSRTSLQIEDYLTGFDTRVAELPSGTYFCYFPMPNLPGMLVRSLMFIFSGIDKREFVRLTFYRDRSSNQATFAQGRHKGWIFASANEIYLAGVNRYAPKQFSLMTIEKANIIGSNYYSGLALTRSGTSLVSTPFCLHFQDGKFPKKLALKSLGFIHASHSQIDPYIATTLDNKIRFGGSPSN